MLNSEFEVHDPLRFAPTRLSTFKTWPFAGQVKCRPETLAEAGFLHRPDLSDDCVQCFVCLKTLDGWEAHEDPWKEHEKHSPDCPYVKLGQPYENLTCRQIVELETSRFKHFYMDVFTRAVDPRIKHLDELVAALHAGVSVYEPQEKSTITNSNRSRRNTRTKKGK
uniref:Baculoviral IAP repeat-containing protein 5.2 n=1 Tax=Schistocephalus solidus TaxID=70667 RepID=A0A0V0J8B9_SCHSO